MPAAVLAGGRSRRMGTAKAALPYGAGTLLEFQTDRLAGVFEEVFAVLKRPPDFAAGRSTVILDRESGQAPLFGLMRALEETTDRIFVLGVDLPLMPLSLVREIARAGMETPAPALLPRADGRLQPLAAVWTRGILPLARARAQRGELSLHELAESAGAEVLPEEQWRPFDPSGHAFDNMNTVAEYAAMRERA